MIQYIVLALIVLVIVYRGADLRKSKAVTA